MSKGKRPRKRRDPIAEPVDGEPEIERQTQEKAELVPPATQPRPQSHPVPERYRPAFSDFVQALRLAVGAMLDLADAAAEAITSRIEGRA